MKISKPVGLTVSALVLAGGTGVGVGAVLTNTGSPKPDVVQVVGQTTPATTPAAPTPVMSSTTVKPTPIASATTTPVRAVQPREVVAPTTTEAAIAPTFTPTALIVRDQTGKPCPQLDDGTYAASDGHCWTYPHNPPSSSW